MICSSALFLHIFYKDPTIKNMVLEYKKLNDEVKSANKTKSEIINCLKLDGNDQQVLSSLFEAEKIYENKFEVANNYFKDIKRMRQEAKILFFPNKEKLVYNLGIAIFVFYLGVSFLMFVKNRKSENNMYIQAMKIKACITLLTSIYFIAYILYPSEGDFQNIVYYISIAVVSLLALYGAFLTIKYIVNLESEVVEANKNVVRFIQLIGRIKRNYLFPLVKAHKENNNDLLVKNRELAGNKLEAFDTDIKDTFRKIV